MLARGVQADENTFRVAATARDRGAIGVIVDANIKPAPTDTFLLSTAARAGDAKLLLRLLRVGVLATAPTTVDEGSPLPLACDAGEESLDEDALRASPEERVECARLLLDAGANANSRDESGQTPLMSAAMHSQNAPLVELLLKRGADPNARDANGQNAAFYAIPVRLIAAKDLENAFDPVGDPVEIAKAKRAAQEMENLDTLRLLRDAGADLVSPATIPERPLPPNWKTLRRYHVPPRSSLLSPLHLAASADRVPTIQFLLESGANIEAPDAGGKTPLHFAAGANAPHAIAALVGAKANIEARDAQGNTALLVACGADFGGVVSYFPLSQMMLGTTGGTDAARALLDDGANVEAANERGLRALHLAIFRGQVELARLLLQRGANSGAPAEHGVTPLHIAARQGQVEIARMLLARGANPNAVADDGHARKTPLDIAREKAHTRVEVAGAKPGAVPDRETQRFLQEVERSDHQLDARRQQVAALLEPKTNTP